MTKKTTVWVDMEIHGFIYNWANVGAFKGSLDLLWLHQSYADILGTVRRDTVNKLLLKPPSKNNLYKFDLDDLSELSDDLIKLVKGINNPDGFGLVCKKMGAGSSSSAQDLVDCATETLLEDLNDPAILHLVGDLTSCNAKLKKIADAKYEYLMLKALRDYELEYSLEDLVADGREEWLTNTKQYIGYKLPGDRMFKLGIVENLGTKELEEGYVRVSNGACLDPLKAPIAETVLVRFPRSYGAHINFCDTDCFAGITPENLSKINASILAGGN